MFHIILKTLEHSGIMQNASYFVSNCVSIGHNIGGLLLFFMALYSENRSLVSCRITKATHFLPLKSGIQHVYKFSWNISLCQTISLIKNECHLVAYYGLFS